MEALKDKELGESMSYSEESDATVTSGIKIYNRLEDNFFLSNKKALFWNFSIYYWSKGLDPWSALPMTFHIDNGVDLNSKFQEYCNQEEQKIKHLQAKMR